MLAQEKVTISSGILDHFLLMIDCLNMYKIYAYNYENCITLFNKMKLEKHPFVTLIETLEK